jgi:thiamine-monophosphate kinase
MNDRSPGKGPIAGEFDFIRHIMQGGKKSAEIVLDNGDDAAVLRLGGALVALSVDTLVENRHFSFAWSTPYQIGFKAMESSLSDIVAVGGRPEFALIAITVPREILLSRAAEIYTGIRASCERTGTIVIGGDTTGGGNSLVISVTALGRVVDPQQLTPRSGARPGDLIFTSGVLGGSAAGLLAITEGLSGFDEIRRRHLEPQCRIDLAGNIGALATSMIDISDGLSSEITHICKASGVGCLIRERDIPLAGETLRLAQMTDRDPYLFAWDGGEDYELLFTVAPESRNRAPGVCIGEITTGPDLLVQRTGRREVIQSGGFDHFKR